jgi:hypothetical protein
MATKGSTIVLIRGGEGINEPSDNLPDTISALLEIDSTVPLRNRGLQPDCRKVFDLDFYISSELMYYMDAENLVLAHRKFGPMYTTLKQKIFAAYPLEADNWDTIRAQRIDAHGAGALWVQGVLKVFAALIGRAYEATKRDAAMNLLRQAEVRGSHKGEIWVSMLTDLLSALTELHPDEVGLVCGAFGGTGPSVASVIGDVLADLKYNVVRVMLASMPDAFMVNGHTPPEAANRLRAVLKVMAPLAVYGGLGWEGVVWHYLGAQMRTIGERFSNVVAKQIAFGCAAVITVAGVPLRNDLEERWMVGMTATNRISDEEAVSRILQGVDKGLIQLDVVPYNVGSGVRVRVVNPPKLKIWQWELLLPALSAARAGIGRMSVPVDVIIKEGGLFGGKRTVKRPFPVESVPEMDKILQRAGVKSVDRLNEAISFWALTRVEREMLQRVRQMPFGEAFAQIKANFVQSAREILSDLVFPTAQNLFPPQSTVLEDPATALFMWGQVNLSVDALADVICGYFAPVDRTAEEKEQERAAEAERQAVLYDKVAQQLLTFEG